MIWIWLPISGIVIVLVDLIFRCILRTKKHYQRSPEIERRYTKHKDDNRHAMKTSGDDIKSVCIIRARHCSTLVTCTTLCVCEVEEQYFVIYVLKVYI